jgi:hypothetical protein
VKKIGHEFYGQTLFSTFLFSLPESVVSLISSVSLGMGEMAVSSFSNWQKEETAKAGKKTEKWQNKGRK